MPTYKDTEWPNRLPSLNHSAALLGLSYKVFHRLLEKGVFTDPRDTKTLIREYLAYTTTGTQARIDREKLKKLEMANAELESKYIELDLVGPLFDHYVETLNSDEDAIAEKMSQTLEGVTEAATRKQIIKAAIIVARNESARRIRERCGTVKPVAPGGNET